MQKTKKIESCLCCGGRISEVVNYGEMPLANNYSVKEKFPLVVMVCETCHHLQLSESVNPEILFSDYPYLSGTSKTSLKFFEEFAETTLRYYPDAKYVFDIACNDGSQLDAYKKRGLNTNGVDPAKNLYKISKEKGHNVVCDILENIKDKVKFDILTAQNVLAHTSTPFEFLVKCKELMHDKSYLFVCTSQADMVINGEYDTLYHEHISYFNTLSMKKLVERAGLVLTDVFKVTMHGMSYVFVIKTQPEINPVSVQLDLEYKTGLQENGTYSKWKLISAEKIKKKHDEIEQYRKEGYMLIGCGAAAKGITFLNISGTKLDCIVDTTPTKWYGEVASSPIYPFEYLRQVTCEKVLFIILAWNFENEIKENILKFRNNENDKIITTYSET